MAEQVTKFVGAMSEEKSASTIKWDRKRPTIKAESAESLMDELVERENTYSDLGCKTWKKKWSVFRPSVQGRAKSKVELELEENQLDAEAIAAMTEEVLGQLYKYLLGCLEDDAHLTAEKKPNWPRRQCLEFGCSRTRGRQGQTNSCVTTRRHTCWN